MIEPDRVRHHRCRGRSPISTPVRGGLVARGGWSAAFAVPGVTLSSSRVPSPRGNAEIERNPLRALVECQAETLEVVGRVVKCLFAEARPLD